jgi:uncharacterized delta-60 repeat protein
MTLITRESKGSALTIEELDGNLEYLESLGVEEIQQSNNKLFFIKPNNGEIIVEIDNNIAFVKESDLNEDVKTYNGVFSFNKTIVNNTVELNYNTNKNNQVSLSPIYGKSYFITGTISRCLNGDCTNDFFVSKLTSSISYNPNGTFIKDIIPDNLCRNITIQSDGKILIGGWFTKHIYRLFENGLIDSAFNQGTGFNSVTRVITLQSDGKILVGGQFTLYNEVSRNYIIRLNSDGTIDDTFNIGSGFNSNVSGIVILNDGKILIVGDFTSYNGTSSNRIIKLNSDGSIDETFDYGVGFDNRTNTIALQSDGKILVGGWFTSYNGTTRNRIIRLNSDGTIDNTFNIGSGFTNPNPSWSGDPVSDIKIQSDGKILIVGRFLLYNETQSNYIIRLNSDGTIDNTFNIGSGFNGGASVLTLQSDGKILVGGQFTLYNEVSRNYIIRLNSDGSIDETFNIGYLVTNWIRMITIQNDKILFSGWSNYLVRVNFDGISDLQNFEKFNPPLSNNSNVTLNNELNIVLNSDTDFGVIDYKLSEINYIE